MGSGPSLPIAASREASELRALVCIWRLICLGGGDGAASGHRRRPIKETVRASVRVPPLSLQQSRDD